MIQTTYYHGDDEPARELTIAQVRAALLDLAGTLWLDLSAPTADELDSPIVGAFDLRPRPAAACRTASRPDGLTVAGPRMFVTVGVPEAVDWPSGSESVPGARLRSGKSYPLTMWLGPNFLVTCADETCGVVGELREAVGADPSLLAEGADRLASRLLLSAIDQADRHAAELETRAEDLEERVIARPREADVAELMWVKRAAGRLERDLSPIAAGVATTSVDASPSREGISVPAASAAPAVREANQVYFDAVADRARRVLARARRVERLATDTMGVHTAIEASRAREALERLFTVTAAMLALIVLVVIVGPGLAALGFGAAMRSIPLELVGLPVIMVAVIVMLWWSDRR